MYQGYTADSENDLKLILLKKYDERLNKDKKGVFCFNRINSIDGRGTLYNDGGLQEFYLFSPDERGCVDFRNFGTKKFNFSNKDISGIKKLFLMQIQPYNILQ